MAILFVGDIMPGGVLPYQENFITSDLQKYLDGYDCRIGTLECALGKNNGPFDPIKMGDPNKQNIVFSRKEDLFRLSRLGINVVSLANNHATDCGVDGLLEMIDALDTMGIQHVGAGRNLQEAKKEVVIKEKNKTIAIIGFQLVVPKPWCFYPATDSAPGIYHVTIDDLCSHIKSLKSQYDYVVVMPHWGEEHSYLPLPTCVAYANRMVQAGVDLIIGSHPHIINPVASFKGRRCFFSLGNFLFPEKCMQVPRPMYYPDTAEECHSLKRLWTYPKHLKEPVVAVWKPKNRIGMMVEMEIGQKMRTSYRLTCLTADNILHHCDSKIVRLRMHFWSLLVKMPKYGSVRKLYYHRYNILRRFIDKLPAFNIPVEL